MRYLTILLAVFAVAGSVAGQQMWPTTKIHDSGDADNRLDIVVSGDGYTMAQQGLFETHVSNWVTYLLNQQPFNRYRNQINIWRINAVSNDSGVDKPAPCYSPAILRDTFYNAKYCTGGTQRCVTVNNSIALGTAALNVPEYDEVIILVNDPEWGGCAGTVAVGTGANNGSNGLLTHEAGHSMFGLADEYWSSGTTYTGGEPGQVNATTHDSASMMANQTKWWQWLGVSGVGTFEGCRYFQFGLYRPLNFCRMRSSGSQFCAVCREQTLVTTWNHVTDYDSFAPAPGLYPYGQTLSVTYPAMGTGSLTTRWYVDGVHVSDGSQTTVGNSTTASLDPSTVVAPNSGNHTVQVRVFDETSWYRRAASYQTLPTRSWVVTDTFANFTVDSFSTPVAPTSKGGVFQVQDTAHNLGGTPSPSMRIGYYLSIDANVTTSDTFLGFRTVPGLPAGGSDTDTTLLRIPVELGAAGTTETWFVGAIADYDDAVSETNESDNDTADAVGHVIEGSPTLVANTMLLNWSSGGTINFTIDLGLSEGFSPYILLLSTSDIGSTGLGNLVGSIPIQVDGSTFQVINGNLGAPYVNDFNGFLSPSGSTTAPNLFIPAVPGLPSSVLRFLAVNTGLVSGQFVVRVATNRLDVLLL